MSKTLVIVESPAKAKTIGKYLGRDYIVEASIGHVRDLPRNAAEVPEKYKGQAWSRLGLDVENSFQALYVVNGDKKSQIAKLKSILKTVDNLLLATDEDREGEAIAWHLVDELKPKVPVRRMVFHEITKEAIAQAIANPRSINENLVQAQEARRAVDRLYGYEVSPVLWKKVKPQLSAGRVQSVATRLLVERERERMRFVPASWWDLEGEFVTKTKERFSAPLVEVDGKRVAAGKDFDSGGVFKGDGKVVLFNQAEAVQLAAALHGAAFVVASTEEKPFTQRPYAPFMTSTLQQEGSRKLNFSASRTMRAAQRLYEGGYITYMRTDSTNLSKEALEAARTQVRELYGQDYLYPTPRTYDKKVKNAQEAHEAIRPAGEKFRTPQSLRAELGDDEWRLYDLVWKRTVASQMADAKGRQLSARIAGKSKDGRQAVFRAAGKTIDFPGFLRAYVEGSDDPDAALEDREVVLPALAKDDAVSDNTIEAKGHSTQAPARYTEASLIQALEERGIGRPSTYASILQTIQERGYCFKRGTALVPTFIGFSTVGLLEDHFGHLVDYSFTAKMEDELDEIAAGKEKRVPYLHNFYFGGKNPGLKPLIDSRLESIDPRVVGVVPVPKLAGTGIEVRVGRYGVFLKRGDDTGNVSDEIAPDELTPEKAEALLTAKANERELGQDPNTGLVITAKTGRFGPYVALGEPGQTGAKNASLLPKDTLEDLTLERALQLLSLPRKVGVLEGEEVWAFNGKFGPYIKRGPQDGKGDSRSLTDPEELFAITLEQADTLLKQPKLRGRAQAKGPVKVFNYEHRKPIELRDGRFGPYLSDGEMNAWLRAGDKPESLDETRALEIFGERAKPPKGKAPKAGAAKSSGSKTGAAKTTARKAPVSKKPASAKKAVGKKAPKKSSAKKPASKKPSAPKPTWSELEPFAKDFDPTTAQLLKLVNSEGVKMDEAATRLRISKEDAMGRYRASNFKLYNLYRKAKQA